MFETLEAMNVRSVSRQSGMPSGGSDCVSSTEWSCIILLFFVSNNGMLRHPDRQRQTPEGVFKLLFILNGILTYAGPKWQFANSVG